MKILIAEDDVMSRKMLESALTKWGYEVVAVSNGNEAYKTLRTEGSPDIAIIDWMMPEMNGLELCSKIRKDEESCDEYKYLMLLTSKSLKEDIIKGIEAGADDYIIKPFNKHELQVRIRAGKRITDLNNELIAAKEKLQLQASIDPLTGAYNRRAIINKLNIEFSRAKREHNPLSIAMLDLDYFKKVNDTFGHQVGDEVLCETIRRITGIVRNYDSVGRYGGEEFLIVTPGVSRTDMESLYERIRAGIGSRKMVLMEKEVTVTASLGVASLDTENSTAELINDADKALYKAKEKGRNRVVFAN